MRSPPSNQVQCQTELPAGAAIPLCYIRVTPSVKRGSSPGSSGFEHRRTRGRRDPSAAWGRGSPSYPVKAEREPGGPLVGCSPVLHRAAVTAHPPFWSVVLRIRVHSAAILASAVAEVSILVGHVKFSLVLLHRFLSLQVSGVPPVHLGTGPKKPA